MCDMLQLVAVEWEDSSQTFSDKLKHMSQQLSAAKNCFSILSLLNSCS